MFVASGIFVGLSTIDLLYAVDEFPAPNSKVVAHSQDVFVGGPAANAAITFAHLGGSATLVTTVGRSTLARVITAEMREYSTRLIDLNPNFNEAPVLSSITVNRIGQRNIVSANATRIQTNPVQVDEAALRDAQSLLVDGHYMEACKEWARMARALGLPVALDGGSWKAGTEELLNHVDTAVCSADFLPPGCLTGDDVVNYLRSRGVSKIAITDGAAPIRFVEPEGFGRVPVPQTHAVDTSGAGDILHGAFCYYTASGLGFAEALGEAAQVASESCKFHGTREWMKPGGKHR